MLRPRRFVSRFDHEYDPGPVQVQARKVHFDVSGIRRNDADMHFARRTRTAAHPRRVGGSHA